MWRPDMQRVNLDHRQVQDRWNFRRGDE